MRTINSLITLGLLSGSVYGQNLSVVQQQEVADQTIYDVAHQTIDSQAPYVE